jgi:lipopolysaccharide/colanic/teichoic acid biosynthesis glycosyltransferase
MVTETEDIENSGTVGRRAILIFIDLFLLFVAFFVSTLLKEPDFKVYFNQYYVSLGIFALVWVMVSSIIGKYSLVGNSFSPIANKILISNIGSVALLGIALILFRFNEFSRTIVFGTLFNITIFEFIVFGAWILVKQSIELREGPKAKKQTEVTIEAESTIVNDRKINPARVKAIKKAIVDEVGNDILCAISRYVDLSLESTLVVSTTTRFNIDNQPSGFFRSIVNIKRINDLRWINKFFESVNAKLPKGGLFVCIAETKEQRKWRILAKFPPVINYIYYTIDYIIKRVFPKFNITKGIYFFLTRGLNRVISRAEALGRLYSCGFDVIDEFYVGTQYIVISKKVKKPAYDMEATYGPLVKLKRVGKGGKIIRVYKMRTMHPYAEYLQEYIYKKHSLDVGGKFKNDFRVSTAGRIMRRLWIDELPMIINLLRGELKIVGVRPLSLQYFNLYTKELQELRIKFKPGLIPPFYVDNPKTLEEIMASEKKYLNAYVKHPYWTDVKYFFVAIYNIIFRKYRSS